MHTDPLAGHFGKTKTIQKTLARYYWLSTSKLVISAKEEENPIAKKTSIQSLLANPLTELKQEPPQIKQQFPLLISFMKISFVAMAAPKNFYLIEEELFSVHWLKNFVEKWEYVTNFSPLITSKQMA
ncbi:hypothetical protein G9A89_015638 [Geosiphon pyriformis]|nr:hypothetical protein G9A89_015638 [Geosiphon pyriformis]